MERSFQSTEHYNNPSLILKKATFNAAQLLGISYKELAQIIGMSESTISRVRNSNDRGIDPDKKEGELSLLFLRVFRSLDAYLGNRIENEKKWLNAENKAFNNIAPLEKMKKVDGLVAVVSYLDAIRGKI